MFNSVAFLLVLLVNLTAAISSTCGEASASLSRFSQLELVRGFNAAIYATRNTSNANQWSENFDRALQLGEERGTNSCAFLFGAQFGFSYRIEAFERSGYSLPSQGLRTLLVRGTLARLKYEENKRALSTTDAELVHVLRISIWSFAAWKASVDTSDDDNSVLDSRRCLVL